MTWRLFDAKPFWIFRESWIRFQHEQIFAGGCFQVMSIQEEARIKSTKTHVSHWKRHGHHSLFVGETVNVTMHISASFFNYDCVQSKSIIKMSKKKEKKPKPSISSKTVWFESREASGEHQTSIHFEIVDNWWCFRPRKCPFGKRRNAQTTKNTFCSIV